MLNNISWVTRLTTISLSKERFYNQIICPRILTKEEHRKNGAYKSFSASFNTSLVAITEIENFTSEDWITILDGRLRSSRVSELETENDRKKGGERVDTLFLFITFLDL